MIVRQRFHLSSRAPCSLGSHFSGIMNITPLVQLSDSPRSRHTVLKFLQMLHPVAGSLAIALVEGQVSVIQGNRWAISV